MRRCLAPAVVLLVPAIAWAACSDAADRPTASSTGLTARGVSLEVPAGDRTLRARGDQLQMVEGEDEIVLAGEARVELDGPSRIEARADRLRLAADGPVVELTGAVRAVFDLPTLGDHDAGL